MDILKYLKVKYIVFHANMWMGARAKNVFRRIRDYYDDDLEIEKIFEYESKKPWLYSDKWGNDIIYRIKYGQEKLREEKNLNWREMDISEWKIQSNIHNPRLLYLKDNNLNTNWSTISKKKTGDYLLLELNKPLDQIQISINLGKSINDHAIDFYVETSTDGLQWQDSDDGYSAVEFFKRLEKNHPDDYIQRIYVQGKDIKYIKLTQIGNSRKYSWSIAELQVQTTDL